MTEISGESCGKLSMGDILAQGGRPQALCPFFARLPRAAGRRRRAGGASIAPYAWTCRADHPRRPPDAP
ncbi:hypothetical protein GCM10018781_61740 [Kitasatospora indigofera]|uniref:Uncharacterized protein n=1 Tax=Kitasatospora indigofera TaxID=67307 RepID=A0A919GB66_9ACTN|nr:hypothetical protein GCM10018781_61740 [Kitasatospora indigofera]